MLNVFMATPDVCFSLGCLTEIIDFILEMFKC